MKTAAVILRISVPLNIIETLSEYHSLECMYVERGSPVCELVTPSHKSSEVHSRQ